MHIVHSRKLESDVKELEELIKNGGEPSFELKQLLSCDAPEPWQNLFALRAEHIYKALFKLVCRLVCKGYCKNLPRLGRVARKKLL